MKLKRLASILLMVMLIVTSLPIFEKTAKADTDYYIEVDITNQIVTVYRSSDHTASGIVRQMICSTGKSGTSTPTGTYYLPSKRYSDERTEWHRVNGAWAQWCTRIVNGILFHSLPVSSKNAAPSAATVAALGSPASHGCVRLRVADAKWIALNCPVGTKVKIYKSGNRNDTLRKLLLANSFYIGNESYESYLGIETGLTKGASGSDVLQLQQRLNALGYNAGEEDGQFGDATYNAVCAFQKASGLTANGSVTKKVWNLIFADDAPVAPLSNGSSGKNVSSLQTALKVLKLYDGEITGTYDDATANAVRLYQSAFGLTVDGTASSSVQKSILSKAAEVQAQFGDQDYEAVIMSTSKSLAKVKVSSTLNLRESASTSSKSLAKLKNGTVVTVLKKGSSWGQVNANGTVGYCKNTYLTFYTESATTLSYEAVQPEPSLDPDATPTPTPDPSLPTPEPTAAAETLDIGSTGSAVANLQNALKTLKLYDGEASGTYDQATADAVRTYQTAASLTANGKADTATQDSILKRASSVKAQFGESDYKPVITTTSTTLAKVKVSSTLNLRASASTSSKSLAKLKNGTVVTVLKKGSTWSQVNANGTVGYCKNTYLVFSTSTSSTLTYEAVTPEPTIDPDVTPTPTPDFSLPTPEPTAAAETLDIGSTGAAVANLQNALKTLKLYDGEASGTYDQATADAVKTYQTAASLTANGKADTATQDSILKRASSVKAQFGDSDYTPVITTTSTTLAKVKVSSTLNLRASASTSSKSLAKLKNGTVVTVLKKGDTWSQVNANGTVGYCKNSYLVFSTTTSSTLTYEASATPTPTPIDVLPDVPADATATPTATETPAPETTPEAELTVEATVTPTPEPLYAVAKAGAKLYTVQDENASDAEEVVEGTVYDVVETDDTWTQVRVDGKIFFILTKDVDLVKVKPTPAPEITATPEPSPTPLPTEAAAEAEVPAEEEAA